MTKQTDLFRLIVGLIAAGALQVTPSAQETPGQESATDATQERAREDRGQKRLLHLADGRVLRERARQVDGEWEIRTGKHWTPLKSGSVTRVKLERDLLEEAQRLRRAVEGDDVRRAAYADWLAGEGLYKEAFATLDMILERDPAQSAALSVLERIPVRIPLPDPRPMGEDDSALGEYLKVASRLGPAARERALAELSQLASDGELPGLHERLKRELEGTRHRRAFALHALRRVFPGREVRTLLGHAVLDRDEHVRVAASQALRQVDDPAVVTPIVRSLGSRHHAVRTNAAQALGAANYAAAVAPLMTHLTTTLQRGGTPRAPHMHVAFTRQIAYVQDFDVEVATRSSIADPVVNVLSEGEVLDAAVLSMTVYQMQTERAAVRRALAALTGASPGHTTAAWEGWWKENGEEWLANNGSPGPHSLPRSPDRSGDSPGAKD